MKEMKVDGRIRINILSGIIKGLGKKWSYQINIR